MKYIQFNSTVDVLFLTLSVIMNLNNKVLNIFIIACYFCACFYASLESVEFIYKIKIKEETETVLKGVSKKKM